MTSFSEAASALLVRLHGENRQRFVLGIAGPPGAGKSTLAEALLTQAQTAGIQAVIVGMDGWHLAHDVLQARGQAQVKGSPETFDAHGFLDAVRRIREQRPGDPGIWVPQFRRDLEDAVAGSIEVLADHRLVIVEGNYLLLDEAPWSSLRASFDEAWMLEPAQVTRTTRLMARHEQHGRTPEQARDHALGSDERNARLVRERSVTADVLRLDPDRT